jgi:glutathione S-transferase
MLTVHHLGLSQSERIVWLCEELAIPYALKRHDRDPVTMLAPPALVALHPMGTAPVIEDDGVVLAESGAIVDYILARYGNGALAVGPQAENFADYLYWLHFANASLQSAMGRLMIIGRVGLPEDSPLPVAMRARNAKAFAMVNSRLEQVPFLAGKDLTAADIMIVFTLTTMRHFAPFDLSPYPAILAYLQRVASRPSYQAAMAKADPGVTLLLD